MLKDIITNCRQQEFENNEVCNGCKMIEKTLQMIKNM